MSRGQKSSSSKPWYVTRVNPDEIHFEDFPGQPYSLNEEGFENFVIDHEEYGLIGSGDLYPRDGYAHLRGAMILPNYREMRHQGDSPFGDLIEKRLEEAGDVALQTDSTTRHGKTQYKYEQFGFHPLGIEPHMTADESPFVKTWLDRHIANPEIYVAAEIEDFLDTALDPLIEDVNYGEPSGNGFEVGAVDLPDSYEIDHITVGKGETPVQDAVSEITGEADAGNYCSQVIIELGNPGNAALLEELLDRGYRPLGVEPEVENCRHYPEPELRMVKLRSGIEDIHLTDKSLEIVEESGLSYSIDRGEKSHRITLEPLK